MLIVSKPLVCRRYQLGTAQLNDNYKLTLEMWMVHLAISKFIDHLLHGFLYHSNANKLIVP